MLTGYMRVLTGEQSLDLQRDALASANAFRRRRFAWRSSDPNPSSGIILGS